MDDKVKLVINNLPEGMRSSPNGKSYTEERIFLVHDKPNYQFGVIVPDAKKIFYVKNHSNQVHINYLESMALLIGYKTKEY